MGGSLGRHGRVSTLGIFSLLRFERAYSAIAMDWSFSGHGHLAGGVFRENGRIWLSLAGCHPCRINILSALVLLPRPSVNSREFVRVGSSGCIDC